MYSFVIYNTKSLKCLKLMRDAVVHDRAGKPLLSALKTNFVKYMNQDNFIDREDMLKLMQDGVEKHFKHLSDLVLSNEYIR